MTFRECWCGSLAQYGVLLHGLTTSMMPAGAAGDAGSLFGRDLLASQREGMSRESSAVSMEAAGARGSLPGSVNAAQGVAPLQSSGECAPLNCHASRHGYKVPQMWATGKTGWKMVH
jgi:hypothetical protein